MDISSHINPCGSHRDMLRWMTWLNDGPLWGQYSRYATQPTESSQPMLSDNLLNILQLSYRWHWMPLLIHHEWTFYGLYSICQSVIVCSCQSIRWHANMWPQIRQWWPNRKSLTPKTIMSHILAGIDKLFANHRPTMRLVLWYHNENWCIPIFYKFELNWIEFTSQKKIQCVA